MFRSLKRKRSQQSTIKNLDQTFANLSGLLPLKIIIIAIIFN